VSARSPTQNKFLSHESGDSKSELENCCRPDRDFHDHDARFPTADTVGYELPPFSWLKNTVIATLEYESTLSN